MKGDALRLELAVKGCILHSTWVARYAFDLDLVSVERVDVLESKLRDQQDELEKLCAELHTGEAAPVLQLEATQKDANQCILWNQVEVDGVFVVSDEDSVIKTCQPGVYSIDGVVNYITRSVNEKVQLMKNREIICMNNCSLHQSHFQSSVSLSFNVRLGKDYELKVTDDYEIYGNAYLSIIRVGNECNYLLRSSTVGAVRQRSFKEIAFRKACFHLSLLFWMLAMCRTDSFRQSCPVYQSYCCRMLAHAKLLERRSLRLNFDATKCGCLRLRK